MNRKIILLGILVFVLIGSIGVTLYLTRQSQDNRSGAQQITDSGAGDSCPAPEPPVDALVDYPSCVGTECDFDKASCSWGDSLDAVSYNVVVTQVESGQEVYNQTVPSSTTSVSFDVVQRTTYRCSVSAVNSCNGVSIASVDEQYCEIDVPVESNPVPTTPVTTSAPSVTPIPTVYVAPTQVVVNETLPPTGGVFEAVGVAVGVAAALAVGVAFFIF